MLIEPAVAVAAVPRVSVALCVCNGSAYLRPQLESILAQSESRLELVALDDASDDDSLAILREYAARDPRVRVESNPRNLGAARSFETAMALARAPFIAPSDQDDVWHPHKLARLLDAIGEHDVAYCDSAYVDSEGVANGRRISDDLAMLAGHGCLRFALANSVSGHAMLLRRELFDAARPFPNGMFHDWWLAARAAGGRGVVYVDEALVQFRRHRAAMTSLGREDAAGATARLQTVARAQAWFEQCRIQLRALSGHAGPARQPAACLLAALELALAGGPRWPLLAEIWRFRHALAPDAHAVAHALRLQARMARRLRRVVVADCGTEWSQPARLR